MIQDISNKLGNKLGSKLAELRKSCGLSQMEVAKLVSLRCGTITNRAVSKWEQGDSRPDADQFIALCQIYGISDVPAVFLGMESGDPLSGLNRLGRERAEEYISMLRDNPIFSSKARITRIVRQIPLYDMPASAGTGVFLDSDSYTMMDVDESVPDTASIAVRISGDSMIPKFDDGQIVYIQLQPELENGEIGIFVLNGDAFCKRLDTENGVKLVSLNPEYKPIRVKSSDELRVVGKVVE